LTAVAIWAASARRATRATPEGLSDATADDSEDPLPAMGVDDRTPLGATSEAHDDLSPHDLPKDHPARKAAEKQAGERGGTTPGHREGGAAPGSGDGEELADQRFERDGARLRR
jgi:hypothetical protein